VHCKITSRSFGRSPIRYASLFQHIAPKLGPASVSAVLALSSHPVPTERILKEDHSDKTEDLRWDSVVCHDYCPIWVRSDWRLALALGSALEVDRSEVIYSGFLC
jgi:hypothetical protein